MSAEPTIEDLLAELQAGRTIPGGSPLHRVLHAAAQEAMRITADLNARYHEESEVRGFLAHLTRSRIDASVPLFPPFHADFGRNIRIGRNVFINMGCKFQDQGGITIADGALIGHNVVIATVNHPLEPSRRGDIVPAPVHIGEGAWIGSNATILPGVAVGDGAVVAAASVVTKDVPAGTVVVGSPARVLRSVPGVAAEE